MQRGPICARVEPGRGCACSAVCPETCGGAQGQRRDCSLSSPKVQQCRQASSKLITELLSMLYSACLLSCTTEWGTLSAAAEQLFANLKNQSFLFSSKIILLLAQFNSCLKYAKLV